MDRSFCRAYSPLPGLPQASMFSNFRCFSGRRRIPGDTFCRWGWCTLLRREPRWPEPVPEWKAAFTAAAESPPSGQTAPPGPAHPPAPWKIHAVSFAASSVPPHGFFYYTPILALPATKKLPPGKIFPAGAAAFVSFPGPAVPLRRYALRICSERFHSRRNSGTPSRLPRPPPCNWRFRR